MFPQRTPSVSLPPSHFLSLAPSFSQPNALYPSGAPSTSSTASNGLAPNTASLASADFEVDVRTGFLPATKNVERLSGEYEVWEEALDAARGSNVGDGVMLGGKREKDHLWRAGVESLPVLATDDLRASLPHLRRAHLVLTFLAHFYVHTTPPPDPSAQKEPVPIPPCISIPLLAVSPLLGLPPILTYADTVLWNFRPVNPLIAPSASSNPPTDIITTFTNTRSEEQFYLISALCEIAGAEALGLMRQSLDELFIADEKALRRLTVYLKKLATQIDRISDITMTLMNEVDPEEFYHLIRPWFRGGDADGPGSTGWDYLGLAADSAGAVAGTHEAESASTEGRRGKLFSGPSAGQSSLIHAIDVFLTVDHSPTEEERRAAMDAAENHPEQSGASIKMDSSPVNASMASSGSKPHGHNHGSIVPPVPNSNPSAAAPKSEATFLQRMLAYMPLSHRSFLIHLSTHPTPLRPLVLHFAASHPMLAQAYDGTLEALRRFRERHMRVVSKFIVQQARRKPGERIRRLTGMEDDDEDEGTMADAGELRGTGGTALFKFLKRCRDNTTKAMLQPTGAGYELK
ncbi:tryptophan 2,3-dioxygenase [Cryptococcus deuterogattii 99/473]|uniref:Tryptophan 2,3-dioxygenase n=1 Tax=Cryptococcus deuterogattii Ram5 TaxID=1296110 RepID=A0A0D0V7H8_9TREE|nr:tryptophan 2,3-dioxygenase [Cryptococcus deuterogattii Ram5]KIY57213.1 tryptophan 2,3-dioxygenase [Cryptococcus deuterogattii 99/473]